MNEHNVIVGNNCFLAQGVSGAFLFGDECRSDTSGAVIVGKSLFGMKIPKKVRKLVLKHPEEAKWIIRAIAYGMEASTRGGEPEVDGHLSEVVDGDGEGV